MCSLSNLLLSFCCNCFIRESRIVSNLNLLLYTGCFCKISFISVKICVVTRLFYDVTMADHTITLKTNIEYSSFSKVFDCRYDVIY